MTPRERIDRQVMGLPIDRLPLLGGWLTTAAQLQHFARCSESEFWEDRWGMALRAYRNIGADGLVCIAMPAHPDDYRMGLTAEGILERHTTYPSPEAVLDYTAKLPEPETLADTFDAAAYAEGITKEMQEGQAVYGDIVHMPARWDIDGRFMWYTQFGYEAFMGALGQYPDRMRKLFEFAAENSRLQNEVLAKVYTQHDCCKVMLMGQDICGQAGPMVSPKWLEQVYFPLAKKAVKPLLDADFKLIWHSDGHLLPILDLILDIGVAGFQGFQSETGTTVDIVAKRRSIFGEKLLFFGGFSSTQTLVFGTPDDVRREIGQYVEASEGRLFLFSTNTINPDAKMENIEAAFRYAVEHPLC